MTQHTQDVIRTARLALDAELASELIAQSSLDARFAARHAAVSARPIRLVRIAQRLQMRTRRFDGVEAMLDAIVRIRQDLLDRATGPPRFLIRVDEFPVASDSTALQTDNARKFHEVMTTFGVPYLMAVVPRPAVAYLAPGAMEERDLELPELDLLAQMQADGVCFAQHGTTHRTRFPSPRHHSELSGLDAPDLSLLLDAGRSRLNALGVNPRVLVPPFNRFDPGQWSTLMSRYEVITGGPESVVHMGLQPTAVWRGDAVYLPCYAPLYGTAVMVLRAIDRIVNLAPATWVPVVLHVNWEASDEFESLRRLAPRLAEHATPWGDFLDAVDRSVTA